MIGSGPQGLDPGSSRAPREISRAIVEGSFAARTLRRVGHSLRRAWGRSMVLSLMRWLAESVRQPRDLLFQFAWTAAFTVVFLFLLPAPFNPPLSLMGWLSRIMMLLGALVAVRWICLPVDEQDEGPENR